MFLETEKHAGRFSPGQGKPVSDPSPKELMCAGYVEHSFPSLNFVYVRSDSLDTKKVMPTSLFIDGGSLTGSKNEYVQRGSYKIKFIAITSEHILWVWHLS